MRAMRISARSWWVVGLVSILGGCFGSGSGGSGDDGSNAALRECSGDATPDEIDDNVVITAEYGESLHEMVACGGLNVALCNGVIEGIVDAIIDQRSDATPDGWSWQGDGSYVTMAENATMETRFYATHDFSFAAAGERVPHDVFLIDNYLVNAAVSVDFTTGRTEIVYDSAGPLVELLGQGATPPNPLEITLDGLSTFQAEFRALEFDSDVWLDDPREHAVVTYHVTTPRLATDALVTGEGMRYDLVEADATREDLDQALVVDEWTIVFTNDGGGQLDGSSSYHLTGGHFELVGEASFEHSTFPETTLSCP